MGTIRINNGASGSTIQDGFKTIDITMGKPPTGSTTIAKKVFDDEDIVMSNMNTLQTVKIRAEDPFEDVGKEEEVVDVDALTPNSSKPPAKKIKLEPKDRHNSGDALAQQKQARMNDLCDLMKKEIQSRMELVEKMKEERELSCQLLRLKITAQAKASGETYDKASEETDDDSRFENVGAKGMDAIDLEDSFGGRSQPGAGLN